MISGQQIAGLGDISGGAHLGGAFVASLRGYFGLSAVASEIAAKRCRAVSLGVLEP